MGLPFSTGQLCIWKISSWCTLSFPLWFSWLFWSVCRGRQRLKIEMEVRIIQMNFSLHWSGLHWYWLHLPRIQSYYYINTDVLFCYFSIFGKFWELDFFNWFVRTLLNLFYIVFNQGLLFKFELSAQNQLIFKNRTIP